MTSAGAYAIPIIMTLFGCVMIFSKRDMHSVFVGGAMNGMKTALSITPVMIILMSGIHMLNASGAVDAISCALTPVMKFLGIPSEIIPLILVRPVSGSAATAMLNDIFEKYGASSFAGRCASVLAGCTDTVIYTVSVYFGAVNIRRTRYVIPAALITQIFAVFISCLAVRMFFA